MGRSKPYFFSFDTKLKPGKIIAHFVTFDSLEVENNEAFDDTTFTLLGADFDADKRIRQLFESVKNSNP